MTGDFKLPACPAGMSSIRSFFDPSVSLAQCWDCVVELNDFLFIVLRPSWPPRVYPPISRVYAPPLDHTPRSYSLLPLAAGRHQSHGLHRRICFPTFTSPSHSQNETPTILPVSLQALAWGTLLAPSSHHYYHSHPHQTPLPQSHPPHLLSSSSSSRLSHSQQHKQHPPRPSN